MELSTWPPSWELIGTTTCLKRVVYISCVGLCCLLSNCITAHLKIKQQIFYVFFMSLSPQRRTKMRQHASHIEKNDMLLFYQQQKKKQYWYGISSSSREVWVVTSSFTHRQLNEMQLFKKNIIFAVVWCHFPSSDVFFQKIKKRLNLRILKSTQQHASCLSWM